ncbi:phosphopantetheine-binding protein [Arthrobacter sp. M4]|uniref:phosphopantetheine-binding protein n=1 Tax=Arthrobacter sp. M4 TaxID=218160 RepID=UPI001CDD2A4B|nr:phosphopantetheine-binding protein [Arthrobacter sp. M4]MCA4135046.1 phosphopantetheine-binding protein [Arthrobacter sp. M4]
MEITALDVIEAIGSTMDELSHMSPADEFTDLDIDSLSLVEAAVILSNKFGVRVDEFELAEAGTAATAASMLTKKLELEPAL